MRASVHVCIYLYIKQDHIVPWSSCLLHVNVDPTHYPRDNTEQEEKTHRQTAGNDLPPRQAEWWRFRIFIGRR